MNVADRIEVEAECTRLVNDLMRCVDTGKYGEATELFAEDGAIDRMGQVIEGRGAILEAFLNRDEGSVGRHLVSSLRFTTVSTDGAAAEFSVSVFSGKSDSLSLPVAHHFPQPAILDFIVSFRRTSAGWRIARQVARLIIAPEAMLAR